jgi:hypothetical protein
MWVVICVTFALFGLAYSVSKLLSGVTQLRSVGPKLSLTLVVNKVEACRQIARAYDNIHFSSP